MLSHPSRVRGLKSTMTVGLEVDILVAPFTGAWIEIFTVRLGQRTIRRTLHGCVD